MHVVRRESPTQQLLKRRARTAEKINKQIEHSGLGYYDVDGPCVGTHGSCDSGLSSSKSSLDLLLGGGLTLNDDRFAEFECQRLEIEDV